MNKIIILQGPPAVGKSTWARNWARESPNDRAIVNRDSIRDMLGTYWVPQRERLVTDIELAMIEAAIKRGFDVAVDATNFQPTKIELLAADLMLDGLPVKVEYLPLIVPIDEAIKRDAERGENGGRSVGPEVIKKFYAKFEKI